jgi:hypothetical protein
LAKYPSGAGAVVAGGVILGVDVRV